MTERLDGMKVAIVVADGFEEVELTHPRRALDDAGADTAILSPSQGRVQAWDRKIWGSEFPVDATLAESKPSDYDALVLPGGVMNPDNLRRNEDALEFVKHFFEADKPVASICHGPWTLIDAGVVRGRKLTSYHTIQTDLKNAGAEWTDEEVVVDGNLVTSRNPGDLEAFTEAVIGAFARARSKGGRVSTRG